VAPVAVKVERLGLGGIAGEDVLAVAVLGVGERQQAALDLHRLAGDGAEILRRVGARLLASSARSRRLCSWVCTCDSALSSVPRLLCALFELVWYCWLCANAWS
jgi:hypothetical protein